MIFTKNKEGFPCCDLCKERFVSTQQIISIIENNPGFLSFFNLNGTQTIHKIEIKDPLSIKMYHKECFFLIAGEDWEKNDL